MDNGSTERRGILIIGHGTRDVAGQAEFLAAVARVAARRPDLLVQAAHLELVEPDIAAGVDRLVEAGATRIVAMPLLLLAAGHAKQDVPEELDAAARRYPHVAFQRAEHLGCHPSLLALAARRFAEASPVGSPAVDGIGHAAPKAERLLVVVGRGSGDVEAQDELRGFVQQLQPHVDVGATRVCFLAMARPSLDDVLAELVGLPYREITVQPHLLFTGDLLHRLRNRVEQAASDDRTRVWRLSAHLGPEEEIATAILGRCGE